MFLHEHFDSHSVANDADHVLALCRHNKSLHKEVVARLEPIAIPILLVGNKRKALSHSHHRLQVFEKAVAILHINATSWQRVSVEKSSD